MTAFDNVRRNQFWDSGVPCVPTVADAPLEFLTPGEDLRSTRRPEKATAIKALEDFEEFLGAAHQISVHTVLITHRNPVGHVRLQDQREASKVTPLKRRMI